MAANRRPAVRSFVPAWAFPNRTLFGSTKLSQIIRPKLGERTAAMRLSLVIFVFGCIFLHINGVELPQKFLGSWTVEKSDNFDEYLTAKGYGWFMRQMVKLASITKTFERNTTIADSYNCKIETTKKNVAWYGWKLDKPFQDEYLDESQHIVTFSYIPAEDKLTEKHVVVEKPDEVPDVYAYTISNDGYLVMRMEYDNVVTNRYYKKVV